MDPNILFIKYTYLFNPCGDLCRKKGLAMNILYSQLIVEDDKQSQLYSVDTLDLHFKKTTNDHI